MRAVLSWLRCAALQNLADCLVARSEAPLEGAAAAEALGAFVVYNRRRKVRVVWARVGPRHSLPRGTQGRRQGPPW